jgi:hypothetical protein
VPKSQHTAADRDRCVRACAADAAANGGHPRFLELERALGPTRHTLRRWWLEAGSPSDGAPAAPRKRTRKAPGQWTGGRFLDHDDDVEVARALIDRLQGLAEEARARGSFTAAARLEVEIRRAVIEDRERHRGSGARGPETPEEWKVRARQFPQLLGEVVGETPEVWELVVGAIVGAIEQGTEAPPALASVAGRLARL